MLLEDRLGDTGFGYAHRASYNGASDQTGAGDIPFYSHVFEDIMPEAQCCKFPAMDPNVSPDDAAASCARYGSVRPSRSCSEYRVPKLGRYRVMVCFVSVFSAKIKRDKNKFKKVERTSLVRAVKTSEKKEGKNRQIVC